MDIEDIYLETMEFLLARYGWSTEYTMKQPISNMCELAMVAQQNMKKNPLAGLFQ